MSEKPKPILVFQTDFTYAEGAVSSMYGVVKSVDRELEIIDGTHQIPRYDIWSGAYRLYQSISFWPKGTIYVSVVDPGVGTKRRGSVARTSEGHIVVTPDNGSLSFLARYIGLEEVREIDEEINRYPRTRGTSVFAGRDIFAYTAARLASGAISWDEIGPSYSLDEIVMLEIPEATRDGNELSGIIEIVDPNFGNAWTNIEVSKLAELGVVENDLLAVDICHNGELVFAQELPFVKSFGYVRAGKPLAYTNEMMRLAFACSQDSFIERFELSFGSSWMVRVKKA